MRKGIIYLALLVALFISCEEYYRPDLEEVPGLLVVESHLTNDPRQNTVNLSITNNFYSTGAQGKVYGAKVDLIEDGKTVLKGTDNGTGQFRFAKTPVPGKNYMLRIVYQNDTYESETVTMPPLPKIDTLYTRHKVAKNYRTNAYGVPELVELPVREICIDASISAQLEYYRFNWRAILQWFYVPPAFNGPPPPMWSGWLSLYDKGLFNLAGPKEFSISDKVQNHPILSLAYDGRQYLDSASQIPSGWIIILDQYGISKSSFDFHGKLNKQLSADGSLFDPVLTQIYGNIRCKNDPSKIALGFFDLNSYRQYRYFLYLGMDESSKGIQRRLSTYPDIPDLGYTIGDRPAFWENTY
jgi:hypothetical protein